MIFRSQSEALSHNMWVMSAMLCFLKNDGYSPSDLSLFSQFASSLSMSLAFQANATAFLTAFVGKKRRDFYISHLPSYFPEAHRRALSKAPLVMASSLFDDDDIKSLVESSQT